MNSTRCFQATDAKPGERPLLIGLVSPSGGGKTYSALELGTGIVKVFGGDLYVIDTESNRALHYADRFKFKHVPFTPPFGPLDYMAAIDYCIGQGARCIVIDSMTHEHTGEGGVLWQSEQALDKWCVDPHTGEYNEGKRNANLARSFIVPKRQRKQLNEYIIQQGTKCAFIFCYRAHEKLDFKRKENNQPRDMGLQPETTSPLMYEMTQQFLLTTGCDGVPILRSSIPDENRIIKAPLQFRDWFQPGVRLSAEIGERFALWARGDSGAGNTAPVDVNALQASLGRCTSIKELQAAWVVVCKAKAALSDADLAMLEAFKDEKKEALK